MSPFPPIADVRHRWHRRFMRRPSLAAIILSAVAPLFASSASEPPGCIDLKKPQATAVVAGVLTVQNFAGPPNYESVAKGDAEEKALILKLAGRVCADDGEFISSTTRFDRIHLTSSDPALLDLLNAAVGRHVTVHGEAFGAHTGHHRAPLVLLVDKVAIR
jgi:hypothetical protein